MAYRKPTCYPYQAPLIETAIQWFSLSAQSVHWTTDEMYY